MGFITADQVERLADKIPNDYGRYLKNVVREMATPLPGQSNSNPRYVIAILVGGIVSHTRPAPMRCKPLCFHPLILDACKIFLASSTCQL